MFVRDERPTYLRAFFLLLGRIFHMTAYKARGGSRYAFLGLITSVFQVIMLAAMFWLMFTVLGVRGVAVRGDFMLFLLSGIFLFLTHVKTVGAVAGAGNSISGMMQHAPMNTLISVSAAAFSTLYTQTLAALVLMAGYHVFVKPFYVYEPIRAIAMFLLAWGLGVSIGLVFMAFKPWAPGVVSMLITFYQRFNMIFSGKMFLANALPGAMRWMFEWNPLFHIIDQARGFVFLNYNPHYTALDYPITCMLVFFMIGLIAEHFTSKHISVSWGKT